MLTHRCAPAPCTRMCRLKESEARSEALAESLQEMREALERQRQAADLREEMLKQDIADLERAVQVWQRGECRCGSAGSAGVAARGVQVWQRGECRCGSVGSAGVTARGVQV
eukprot:353784-Chlamydomonas_euryale.AAC.4